MNSKNEFNPNYAVPPGETLLETIESICMTQTELAQRMGRPQKTISEIINGKAAITPETALQLEKVLGIPASFWNSAERNYRETLARLLDQQQLVQQVEWIKNFPSREMVKLGWIPHVKSPQECVQALLQYLGIASTNQWEILSGSMQGAFRQSPAFKNNEYALGCWLRQGEIQAQKTQCRPFNEGEFRHALRKIRDLTRLSNEKAINQLKSICAEVGVAFVLVPEIKGTHVSGVTRWLGPEKAIIQQSYRYKTEDHFWFTFFHEAGHILLHGKKSVFIEIQDIQDSKEEEANRFSSDTLIAESAWLSFLNAGSFTKQAITTFADQVGISPGIVVGRLQHEKKIPHKYFNDLKVKIL